MNPREALTVREAADRAARRLESSPHLREGTAGQGEATRDALTLLLHVTGLSRAQFHADPDRSLTVAQQADYNAAIARRLADEPIQYITGEQEFYGLALGVTPAVLIPRPETEHLVEAVLAALDTTAPHRILDVGTGSGAIAIALAAHLPRASITATDISPDAIAVARGNAARHSLADRIQFLQSDLLTGLPNQEFDAVVSNPPYVSIADRATLHPQVRDYEPAEALFAGPDGLGIYRRLLPQAQAALTPNGLLALEIGHGQRDALAQLLASWSDLRFVDDLQGIPRVALARKP